MFQYQVAAVPSETKELFKSFDRFVVVGMGGSVLPLKALRDAAGLQTKIILLDQTDPEFVRHLISENTDSLFCIASKSGETLEIKALLSEILQSIPMKQIFCVTDPQSGSLRKWVVENGVSSLPIPTELGGRFTNFSIFHRALLERFGIDFEDLLLSARDELRSIQSDPHFLEDWYRCFFEDSVHHWVLWFYGTKLRGLAEWAQQALAESLGKKSKTGGLRVGKFPIVLQGPGDQHSVLQLLRDGPQDNAFLFLCDSSHKLSGPFQNLPEFCKNLEGLSLKEVQEILMNSTTQSFEERLSCIGETQSVMRWDFEEALRDAVRAIVRIQAFVEYAGECLGVNAFDQPGVERGKQIAREMIEAKS